MRAAVGVPTGIGCGAALALLMFAGAGPAWADSVAESHVLADVVAQIDAGQFAAGRTAIDKALAKGIIVNLTAQKVIRLAPPVNISNEEWDRGLDVVIDLIAGL